MVGVASTNLVCSTVNLNFKDCGAGFTGNGRCDLRQLLRSNKQPLIDRPRIAAESSFWSPTPPM